MRPGPASQIRLQTEFLIEHKLKPALEAAGSSLEQSVKAQIYLADIADVPDCLDVWNAALRRHSLRRDGGADQIVRDGRRHHRDQPDRADQRRERAEKR